VAFTSSAFALHGVKDMFEYTPQVVKSKKAQIEFSGHIRARGELADNNSDFHDNDGLGGGDDEKASYDARVNLMMKVTVSPNTMGVIELQSEKHTTDGNSDSYGWGSCTGAKGTYTAAGNCKPADISLRQAYIATQGTELLGNLSGFKVGHMPIALGNGQYYNHSEFGDDAIVIWTQPMDNTEIALAIIKGAENGGVAGGSADDTDIYALTFTTAAGGANIGGDISFLNDNSSNAGISTSLWNLGLRADLDLSGVKISIDGNIQSGEVETDGAADVDLEGFAIEISASTNVGAIGIHGGIGYGSGNDIDDASSNEMFITSLGNGQDYTYLYDQKAITAATGASSRTGLANTTYVNVGASTNVNPDVKVSGDLYWLQASEKLSNAAGLDSEDIGWEIDTKITYQIDSNLVWYVEAGYLFADDFYRNVTGATVEPDDAYSVRHGVILTF
jgi:hypothetical protein